MFRRILLSTGAGASLLLAACENTVEPRPECNEFFPSLAETRGDTVVLTTGLRYIETEAGTGATVVGCRGVAISTRGEFLNGTEFQPLIPLPFTPGVGQYIVGLEQGVVGMRVGGKRRLIIPPALAYGSEDLVRNGQVVIPGNSTIVFDVEAQAVEQ